MTTQVELKTRLAELDEERQRAFAAWDRHRMEVECEASEAARRAREVVIHRHRADADKLLDARHAAERAWQAEVDASASHEWEGRKVVRHVGKGRRWNRSTETFHGIVEVRRSGTAFPANAASYSLPRMGEPFVRLLKKDGTVGQKVETRWFRDWKLAE